MALITCPECGRQISDHAQSCPHCGYVLQKSKVAGMPNFLPTINTPVLLGIVVALVLCVVGVFVLTGLNPYEETALENCQTLKRMLKDPNSFTLYENIYIYPDSESYGTLYYISYGGANSYGAMVQDVAVFEETTYLGNYGDDESDFYTQEEYDYFLLAEFYYTYNLAVGNNFEEFTSIDSQKIMRHLE